MKMKIYDPMGIMSPFTQQAKCLLRETRTLKLGWDEELPNDVRSKWISFFSKLFELSELEYDRCVKPHSAVGSPSLVILCDGSNIAYVRWGTSDGSYWSR